MVNPDGRPLPKYPRYFIGKVREGKVVLTAWVTGYMEVHKPYKPGNGLGDIPMEQQPEVTEWKTIAAARGYLHRRGWKLKRIS